MIEDHLKAALKSELLEYDFDGDKPLSMISMYSSSSSQDEDDQSSTRK